MPVEIEITDLCLLVEVVELVDTEIISIKNKLFQQATSEKLIRFDDLVAEVDPMILIGTLEEPGIIEINKVLEAQDLVREAEENR